MPLPYDPDVLGLIRKELEFFWQLADLHKLKGQMRLYSGRDDTVWELAQHGFEVWFGPHEIPRALEKIELFYREAQQPNTPLFLEPIVYDKSGSTPIMVGMPCVYGTLLGAEGEIISEESLARLKKIGVHASPLTITTPAGKARQGYKLLGFLKDALRQPAGETNPYSMDGAWPPLLQAVHDLAHLTSGYKYAKQHLISGLEYSLYDGSASLYHDRFSLLLEKTQMREMKDTMRLGANPGYVMDAGLCWNAYQHKQVLWDRYGVDASNLQKNLKYLNDSNAVVQLALKDAQLIFRANARHFKDKKPESLRMRLFSAPNQTHWRAKQEGTTLWFREADCDSDALRERVQFFYNAGMLPNTPLFLDPILYEQQADGSLIPLGCGVAWATALATGQHQYSTDEADQRFDDIGVLHCSMLRGGTTHSGVKLLTFLDKPYIIPDTEQKARAVTSSEVAAEKSHNLDALPVPGCKELFDLSNVNADPFYPYYTLAGLEYLTTHGSFANSSFPLSPDSTIADMDALIASHTQPLQKILDAQRCWESYDRLHALWVRFGPDISKLEHNVRFFNLCGRDLNLFNMTGEAREDAQDEFEFFVPGWIPKSSISIIGATGGTGKSSLAHRLAVLASIDWRDDEPAPQWLGATLDKSVLKGLVVYFSGEDSPAIVNARAKMIDPTGRSSRLLVKYGNEFGNDREGNAKNISHFLHDLAKLPEISLIVIDPARKYLLGDEDNSEVVSNFFEAIEMISIKQKCPVVVVHHLKKEAHPADTRDIYDLLRGSQVFIDRPRVIIGMMREGPHIVAGLSKNNIPPRLGMVEGERIFARDPETLDLFWLPGPEGTRTYNVTEAELLAMKAEREKKL